VIMEIRRTWWSPLALIVAVTSGATTGCADNESMLFIRGVMAREAGNCEMVADDTATLLTAGIQDVGFLGAYSAALLVGNQLASRGQKTRSRTETSSITLEGAEVTLVKPNGSRLRTPFTSPGTGFVQVGSGQENGYGVMSSVLVPYVAALEALEDAGGGPSYAIAEIRAFGKTLGGQEVESGIFKFPVNICRGCLVTFPMSSVVSGDVCQGGDDTNETMPCVMGQDDVVSCAVCAGQYDVCARVP
jgi:hypothetical protein